jgi:hypothetical protein
MRDGGSSLYKVAIINMIYNFCSLQTLYKNINSLSQRKCTYKYGLVGYFLYFLNQSLHAKISFGGGKM